jgi:preprotein translocase subunit SecF
MNKLTKCKLILSILPSLFFLVGMFFGKNTFDFYMYLIVGIVFPIISWFVIQYSLKQYGKEYEKNRKK